VILIALGANLPSHAGEPVATLRAALGTLPQRNVAVETVSPFYRSIAWPNPRDPEFVNAVARIGTELPPYELLEVLKQTERMFGRESAERNSPRPLDLDILDYNARVEAGPPTLPHPRLHERGFVLIPLRDVAPDWRHPVSGVPVTELIESLPADARVLMRLDEQRCA
jgi:2-amino-4-hydroxy-6-hydroxymethyldihydropteridine diphosphokinase